MRGKLELTKRKQRMGSDYKMFLIHGMFLTFKELLGEIISLMYILRCICAIYKYLRFTVTEERNSLEGYPGFCI